MTYKLLKRKDLQKVLSYIIYFKYLYLQQNVCVYAWLLIINMTV